MPADPVTAQPSATARLKDLLDETRMLMLGLQLLLGLQYQAAFASGFVALPVAFQALDGAALLLLLAAAALLLGTPAFHQIAWRGGVAPPVVHGASRNIQLALAPLGLSLSMDVAIGTAATLGAGWAALAGVLFAAAVGSVWFALPLRSAHPGTEIIMTEGVLPLETRIAQALTEIRVILPGAQAVFGFQFAAILTSAFDRLTPTVRVVHLASLGVVALSILLLMAPVAYHRIASHGDAEQGALDYAVRMMLLALGLLALGFTGDAFVTLRQIGAPHWLALAATAAVFAAFATMLYGLPLAARRRGMGERR